MLLPTVYPAGIVPAEVETKGLIIGVVLAPMFVIVRAGDRLALREFPNEGWMPLTGGPKPLGDRAFVADSPYGLGIINPRD